MSSLDENTAPARTRAGRYHHGDLKDALIAAAERLVEARGADGFTLKDAAGMAGVSVAAPYRHFADRAALLDVVAERGFVRFGAALRDARDRHPAGSVDGIIAMGQAYVRFVADHPRLARMMFDHRKESFDTAGCTRPDALQAAGAAAFTVLIESVTGFLRAHGRDPGAVQDVALPLWSLVHGTANLVIDRNFERMAPAADTNHLVAATTRRYLAGFLAEQPAGIDG